MEKVTSHSFGGHLVPHSYPLPYTSPIPLPMPREFNGKKYYGAADVAKILGVTQKTVWKWQNELYFGCPLFTADERAHDGRYLYTVERVMQLKSVYHPNWTRGGYEEAPAEIKRSSNKSAAVDDDIERVKYISNLPAQMLAEKRFFPVTIKNGNKKPMINGWNQLENLMTAEEAASKGQYVGYLICAKGDDPKKKLFMDFDHVLDDAGNFVNTEAERTFNDIMAALDNCYAERSVSGHGIHIIAEVTAEDFESITNKDGEGVLHFDLAKNAKLELFYQTEGRYCLMTGDFFECEAGAVVPSDENVNEVFASLLRQIKTSPLTLEAIKIKDALKKKKTTAENIANRSVDGKKKLPPEIQELVDKINSIPLEDLEAHGYLNHSENGDAAPNGYICPWCFSGTHKHKTGALTFYAEPNNNHVYCHSQGCCGDVIDLIVASGDSLNEKNFFEHLEDIAEEFGIHYDKKIFESTKPQARLKRLQSEPPTAENVKEIQKLIRKLASWNQNRDGQKTSIKNTFANAALIFDNDVQLRGLVGYDSFSSTNLLLKNPPWKRSTKNKTWKDSDDAQLRLYLRENYAEFGRKDLVDDMFVRVCETNSFNAVEKFFESLPPWDGKHRAETLFIKFLKAEDSPYVRKITMNWLTAAVARIYFPGCEYQIAIVLHGRQGIGKSYLLKALGGDWYGELIDNVDDRHANDAIRSMHIVEIAEMAGLRKSEINAQKAFISRAADVYRPAYGRNEQTFLRHCVFAITCNDDEFLTDPTGNRRYAVIECGLPMLTHGEELTTEYIHQVWSEVFAHFKELFKDVHDAREVGKLLELSRETKNTAAEIAESFTRDDGLTTEILGFLDQKIPSLIVWYELSREDRRKFFVNGCTIIISEDDLWARAKNHYGKDFDDIRRLLVEACKEKDDCVKKLPDMEGSGALLKFYGCYERKRICAAEIFNECFGNDNRKKMPRIVEILSKLDGWKLGERLQKQDPQYPDQKKPYYRIKP